MLSHFVLLTAFAASTFAQELGATGPNNQTTPTVNDGEIIVHVVQVGKEMNQFTPNSILANPGDLVMFQFYEGNHSVIQSLYGWPCMPRAAVDGIDGFFSEFFPEVDPNNPPTWNITIVNTDPIWYYCGQVGSCVNWGMLGVINPNKDSNLTAQIELARQSKVMVEPGQTLPANEAASVSSLANEIMPKQDEKKPSGLSGGAIAGIVIGTVIGAALVGAVMFFLIQRNTTLKKRLAEMEQPTQGAPMHEHRGSSMIYHDLPQYQEYYTPQDGKEKSPERQSAIYPSQVALMPMALMPGQQNASPQIAPMNFHNIELEAADSRHELAEAPVSMDVGERGRHGA